MKVCKLQANLSISMKFNKVDCSELFNFKARAWRIYSNVREFKDYKMNKNKYNVVGRTQ